MSIKFGKKGNNSNIRKKNQKQLLYTGYPNCLHFNISWLFLTSLYYFRFLFIYFIFGLIICSWKEKKISNFVTKLDSHLKSYDITYHLKSRCLTWNFALWTKRFFTIELLNKTNKFRCFNFKVFMLSISG